MGWYGARLVFESVDGDSIGRELRDESIRILRATSDEHARERAIELGRSQQTSYIGGEGNLVTWRFINVEEIQDLCTDEIEDGAEVFSTLNWIK